MRGATGKYYGYPVAADIEGPYGPETATRYAVITPTGDLLHKRIGGPRLFKTLDGARRHAWNLNNPHKGRGAQNDHGDAKRLGYPHS